MSEIRLSRSDLESGQAGQYRVPGTVVCVVRIGDDFYAIGDKCSHENISLSEGDRVDEDARTIECWRHGSTFSLVDGIPDCPPASKAIPVYPVSYEADEVVVRI